MGTTLHRGARASHHRGLSRCGAQAPDAQAQQLWLTGLVAPWHVGYSQTRARTRVPCIGRQTLNHCATREARSAFFYWHNLLPKMIPLRVRLSLNCSQRPHSASSPLHLPPTPASGFPVHCPQLCPLHPEDSPPPLPCLPLTHTHLF